jgi:NAD(P)-dependent dehydrogenase (short-subunit alcohol dehydrogenase family)
MKTAIITGSAGNMGQAIVEKFLESGFQVIGTVEPGHDHPGRTAHPGFEQIEVDVSDETAAEQFFTGMVLKYQTIDVVICTVGGFAMGNIANTRMADIGQQYKLNFETAYHVARPALAHMMENNNGRIFLVGSKPGLSSTYSKGMVAYGLSKSLIFRLAELMNQEARGTNVVTSVIVPGTIDTAANRASMPTADFDSWVKPAAIAEAVYFYCTEEAAPLREPIIKLYNNS